MRIFATAAACLACTSALAQTPRLVPDRDVTVSYHFVPRKGPEQDVLVAIQAGGTKLRITGADIPAAITVDRDSGVATLPVPFLKCYATADITQYDPVRTILPGAHFERHGRHIMAGIACTEWTAHASSGAAEGCITDDGVILRGSATSRRGLLGTLTATHASYGWLPPDIFAPPLGYRFAGEIPLPRNEP